MPPEIIRFSPEPENNKEIEPDLKTAIIYAGQGQDLTKLISQSTQLMEHPAARGVFNQADEFLHDVFPDRFPEGLSTIIKNSEEDVLKQNSQLLVVLYNLACKKVLGEKKGFPSESNIVGTAGQSLGFVSALNESGATDVPNTLHLTVKRQEAMMGATGTLAAFIASDSDERIKRLKEDHDLETSIITSTNLVVLGGEVDAINAAIEDAKNQNVRAILLRTDGAFHTKHMRQAAQRFKQSLRDIEIKDAQIDVFANTTGKRIRSSRQLTREAINQIPNTVLWLASTDSMTYRADQFIEIGNEGLLTGHIQRDLEKRTGEKGHFVKRLLVACGAAAVGIGAALTIRQPLKNT